MAIRGAVLTGGAGRRMGRPKAMIAVDGVPMARRVADALVAGGCIDVVLVGGDAAPLAPLDLPVIPDRRPGSGPLGGVLTALAHCDPTDDVVVAACDLPRLDAASVEALVRAAAVNPDAQVVVARTDRIEPACALWRGAVLDPVEQLFLGGTRAVHRALAELRTIEVAVRPAAFVNVNRPEDLAGQ